MRIVLIVLMRSRSMVGISKIKLNMVCIVRLFRVVMLISRLLLRTPNDP